MKRILVILVVFFAYTFAQEEGTLKWKFEAEESVYWGPVIGDDGNIYFGSGRSLYALDNEGEMIWKYESNNNISSFPAIDDEGTIYIGIGGFLSAFSQVGELKWEYPIGDSVYASPAIGPDGTIYCGSNVDTLYAISPTGELKWKFYTPASEWTSSVVIGYDGTIYAGVGSIIYAFTPSGELKWSRAVGLISSPISIGYGESVYVGSHDTYLYAVNPDGTNKWRYKTDYHIYSAAATGSDGTIYFGSGFTLYALNPDGSEVWEFFEGIAHASPAIGSDGIIYYGSYNNFYNALTPSGDLKWKFTTGAPTESPTAISSGGVVYFGSNDSFLYAVNSSSYGLADSPWPTFYRDNKNSGCAEQLSVEVTSTEIDNEDGLLHPAQSAELIVTVKNTGEGALGSFTGVLSTEDPKILIPDSLGGWDATEPGSEVTNDSDPFTLHLVTDSEDGYRPMLNLILTDTLGVQFEIEFQVFEPSGIQKSTFPGFEISIPSVVKGYCFATVSLGLTSKVNLSLFDACGRHIKTLYCDKLESGSHVIPITLKDIPAGVYFIRVEAKSSLGTQKVILVK